MDSFYRPDADGSGRLLNYQPIQGLTKTVVVKAVPDDIKAVVRAAVEHTTAWDSYGGCSCEGCCTVKALSPESLKMIEEV